MGRLGRIERYSRQRIPDTRGWLVKIMSGLEAGACEGIREVYLTYSVPGETRGHHYHLKAREWFTVIRGEAEIVLEEPETGELRIVAVSDQAFTTLEIPPGVAHAVTSVGAQPLWMIAASSELHDPADVHPYQVRCEGKTT